MTDELKRMTENIDNLSIVILKMRDENRELKAENERLKDEIQMLLNELNK
jgi:predicted RNase H-like nuclease (RuvC/YqgF family)